MNCSKPGLPVHHQLPELTQTHVHRVDEPSSHLILCRPLLLLPPIPPSIRVFYASLSLRGLFQHLVASEETVLFTAVRDVPTSWQRTLNAEGLAQFSAPVSALVLSFTKL